VVAAGWHASLGEEHAEVAALKTLNPDVDRSTLTAYVTLEPCSHQGRTPPCADRLVAEGIGRVVVGMEDPDPRVSGRGIVGMRESGMRVDVLPSFPEGRWLNRRFLSSLERGRPWIILKWAESADGFMDPPRQAGQTGSIPITSPALRSLAHRWRSEEQAILVGAGTVCVDNPRLDVRSAEGPDPMPIVLDPNGRTAPSSMVYHRHPSPMVIGGPEGLPSNAIRLDAKTGLDDLLTTLVKRNIRSVLVEGGAETHRRFIESGRWDECRIAHSPNETGGGLPSPMRPNPTDSTMRGEHPFGEDRVTYLVRKESADWAGIVPPPTLQIPFPS